MALIQKTNLPLGEIYIRRYYSARINLLLIAVMSLVNIILLMSGNGTYFFFSAAIPYMLVDLGMFLCGKYPEGFYEEGYLEYELLDPSFYVLMVALALLCIAFYFLFFIFSDKGRGGWLIGALVFFSIDTLNMIINYGIGMDSLLELLIRIYVIVSLSFAIHAYVKLKSMPPPVTDIPRDTENEPLRYADMNVKSRVFVEAVAFDRKITYRRVGRVNELIIDGMVYGEYNALIETAHSLTAVIDNHVFEVGYDGTINCYVKVDGETVAKKKRWY